MAKLLLFVGLSLALVCGAGCVVIDVGKAHVCKPAPTEPQGGMSPGDEAVVCIGVHTERSLLR